MVLLSLISSFNNSSGDGGTAADYMRIRQYENGTRYNAWGVAIPHTNVIDYFYSSALFHAGQATSRRIRIDRWGNKIEDVEVWSDPSKSRRDFGGGITSNGTMIIFYVEHLVDGDGKDSTLTGLGYYRSTDGFATFTDHPASMDAAGEIDCSNYGNLIENPTTHRLYHTAYGVSTSRRLLTYYSDDDGLTWTLLSTTGSATQYSEGSMTFISGTTNANAVLGYFVRNDVGVVGFFRSTDGGSSFSFVEELSWTSTASKALWAENDGTKTIIMWTDRSSQNYVIRGAEFDNDLLATVSSTLDARTSYRTIYESFITSRPFSSSNLPGNFGYTSLAKNGPRNKWWVALYDMSPKQHQPYEEATDVTQCDIVFVPYEADVRVKARATGSFTFTDEATTPLTMGDVAEDSHGAWNGNKFTAPVSGDYQVAFNLPIQNYGTKIFRVKKNNIEDYTYTETPGLLAASGKLQGYYNTTLSVGDILSFEVSVSGAGTNVTSDAGTTPTNGLAYTVDITNAIEREVVDDSSISPATFTDSVPAVMKTFTIPETGWYTVSFTSVMPNTVGGRRIFQVFNYEVDQENQETRRKLLYQVEDRARDGATTTTDALFTYKLNQGETIKLWFTIYSADITSGAGTFSLVKR